MTSSVPSPRFVVHTVVLLAVIRLGLWLFPFRIMRKVVERSNNPELQPATWPKPEQIANAVTIGSEHVPQASCLTQALAAKFLLQKYGHPAELRIGVTRNKRGEFEAHAWIESNQQVIIGGTKAELERFVEMPTFETKGL